MTAMMRQPHSCQTSRDAAVVVGDVVMPSISRRGYESTISLSGNVAFDATHFVPAGQLWLPKRSGSRP